MGLLRRRTPSPDPGLVEVAAAFGRCAEHVDLAQRAMIRCVPSSARATPLPLAVGAETLRESLAAAVAGMAAWNHPAVAQVWEQCSSALTETLAGVDNAVARVAATRELEVALTAVQDLLDPLHAFVDAEEALAAGLRR